MANIEKELQFYLSHLKNDVFPFWEENAIDEEQGGFFTCFDNRGMQLLSHDKFTWSQGRMVWVLSQLYRRHLFDDSMNEKILSWARKGGEFLMEHCLLPNGNCTFLMDRKGTPKPHHHRLDSSIYADCFVIIGLSALAEVTGDAEALQFAIGLYASVLHRYDSGCYYTEPYPVPQGYRAHGIPMILTNTSRSLADSMQRMGRDGFKAVSDRAYAFARDVLDHFVDENDVLHEMIYTDNTFDYDSIIGRYINPGHTIEDAWFILTECQLHGDQCRLEKTVRILKKALKNGWDSQYGGLLLFADQFGGPPQGTAIGLENHPMVEKIRNDWQSKLWWPHSEGLYSTLLAYWLTKDQELYQWYRTIFEYTFRVFPNRENSQGEWIQIRDRLGRPENRIVALPVKDPFHIIRNLILIIDLLHMADCTL